MFDSIADAAGPIEVTIDLSVPDGGLIQIAQDYPHDGDAGVWLPRRCTGTVATGAGYSVTLDIAVMEALIRPTRIDIQADGLADPIVVAEVGFYLYSLVEEILVTWRASIDDGSSVPSNTRVREAIRATILPRQRDDEPWPHYVYRLWMETYEPSGRTQEHLAADLDRSHDLVRKYVSEQGRANKERPRKATAQRGKEGSKR